MDGIKTERIISEVRDEIEEELEENRELFKQSAHIWERRISDKVDKETFKQLEGSLRLYVRTLVPETAID